MDLVEISDELTESLNGLSFDDPVTHVYRPLVYARALHTAYLERFGQTTPREAVLVGMNPGPWGMGQTGVPFGDVDFVRDWMGLEAEVGHPDNEHPKRPVEGLDCERNEVSGSRLWGWTEERFGSADDFFERFYVHNYCPLLFLEESGRNRPPSRMKVAQRRKLTPACDHALRQIVDYLDPDYVLGIGNYARDRIKRVYDEQEVDFEIGVVLHPSPASPKANQGWAALMDDALATAG
ncbi:MAG: uracil-DNA glycosylase family protein, partial [Bradymonadaceae bacterium]